MKIATLREIKTELEYSSKEELIAAILRLTKFKKENKELLTYLLFESSDEDSYIQSIENEVEALFKEINTSSFFYMKKTIRKILKRIKTYIRYSKKKETEVELLLYFCEKMKELKPSIKSSIVLSNIYKRELISIEKKVCVLHEDLQYEYNEKIAELKL